MKIYSRWNSENDNNKKMVQHCITPNLIVSVQSAFRFNQNCWQNEQPFWVPFKKPSAVCGFHPQEVPIPRRSAFMYFTIKIAWLKAKNTRKTCEDSTQTLRFHRIKDVQRYAMLTSTRCLGRSAGSRWYHLPAEISQTNCERSVF